MTKWLRRAAKLAGTFQVTDGRRFRLASIDPGDTGGFESKRKAQAHLARASGSSGSSRRSSTPRTGGRSS